MAQSKVREFEAEGMRPRCPRCGGRDLFEANDDEDGEGTEYLICAGAQCGTVYKEKMPLWGVDEQVGYLFEPAEEVVQFV